jgi:predicted ATPase
MLTRIEIDGFKTFENFEIDLEPFCAVVGPNASGKSNLFDALRFLSALSQTDIRTAMQNLRGEPEELFRRTQSGEVDEMSFAIEVLLQRSVEDAFGQEVKIDAQRLRYELRIARRTGSGGGFRGVFVDFEECSPIKKASESSRFVKNSKTISYAGNKQPFIRMRERGRNQYDAIEIRQDAKRGRPITLAVADASRTALSTITTAEFPHLYALKDFLASIRFLQIDPQAARRPSDRLSGRVLAPDASNLATLLARIQSETASRNRPQGALSDIAADLSSLITSVRGILVQDDERSREYAFDVELEDNLSFSSRVISDGTLRLLALLTILNDPERKGLLCFEEPENGVHEGRIPQLVSLLRNSCTGDPGDTKDPYFQILTNTHSPVVMQALKDEEIIAADTVTILDPVRKRKSSKTRMRTGVTQTGDLVDPDKALTRFEIDALLKKTTEAA